MPGTNHTHGGATLQLDVNEIVARLDGDFQLLADLCDLSLAELPGMFEKLSLAVEAHDANLVHRAAHRLKGSLSILGEGPHLQDCLAMEELALKGELARAPELLKSLAAHLKEFSAAVEALGKESHARTDRR